MAQDSSWHIATVEQHKDWHAASALQEAGIQAFAPFAYRKILGTNQGVKKFFVFGGYVFFKPRAPGVPWQEAARTRCVRDVLKDVNGNPEKVTAAWMRAHMDRCDPGGYWKDADEMDADVNAVLPPVSVGEDVKLLSGSMAGLVVRVTALEKKGLLCVDIEMFGSTRPVSVPRAQVEAVVGRPERAERPA